MYAWLVKHWYKKILGSKLLESSLIAGIFFSVFCWLREKSKNFQILTSEGEDFKTSDLEEVLSMLNTSFQVAGIFVEKYYSSHNM